MQPFPPTPEEELIRRANRLAISKKDGYLECSLCEGKRFLNLKYAYEHINCVRHKTKLCNAEWTEFTSDPENGVLGDPAAGVPHEIECRGDYWFSCRICKCGEFYSAGQAIAHTRGRSHQSMLSDWEGIVQLTKDELRHTTPLTTCTTTPSSLQSSDVTPQPPDFTTPKPKPVEAPCVVAKRANQLANDEVRHRTQRTTTMTTPSSCSSLIVTQQYPNYTTRKSKSVAAPHVVPNVANSVVVKLQGEWKCLICETSLRSIQELDTHVGGKRHATNMAHIEARGRDRWIGYPDSSHYNFWNIIKEHIPEYPSIFPVYQKLVPPSNHGPAMPHIQSNRISLVPSKEAPDLLSDPLYDYVL